MGTPFEPPYTMQYPKQGTVLLELSRLMASSPDARKALEQMPAKLRQGLPYDGILLWIFHAKELGMPAFLSAGLQHEIGGKGRAKALPVARKLLDTKNIVVSDDLAEDRRWVRPERLIRQGFSSAIGLSLIAQGHSQGALFFFSSEPRAFKGPGIRFLRTLANTLALHIHSARLDRRSHQLAAKLEKASRNRVEILTLLSRELRTPLTIVLGHAALMHEGLLGQINPMQESGLEAIMRSSRDLLTKVKVGLEQRVVERTAELSKSLEVLREENIQRRRMERELRRSREQLRELSRRVLSAQEDERRRIAREVHDELGQALTALKIDLTWISQKQQEDLGAIRKRTAGMIDLVDRTIREVRRIARELRPGVLDDLGLVAAIEWQTQEFETRTGIRCHLEISPDIELPDPACSTAVFRIFQEALTNVARHSQATEVSIRLATRAGQLYLEVEDNGRGIQQGSLADTKSFGLVGMRERVLPWGGRVEINSPKNGGTAVMVKIPIRHKRTRTAAISA